MAEVILPSLGESITEGIVIRWFKAVGEAVERDEPLFEISTDKVDSEVPAPASGVLTQILAEEGDTVAVGAAVAVIGAEGDVAPSLPAAEAAEAPAAPQAAAPAPAPSPSEPPSSATGTGQTASPMVRRLLADAGVEQASVPASGPGARITRSDAERAIAAGPAISSPAGTTPSRPSVALLGASSDGAGARVGFVAIEADFEAVVRARRAAPALAAEIEGLVLDDRVFVVRAAVEALAEFPKLNATLTSAGVEVHANRNVGVSIDLAHRLLIPVVAGAQDLNLRGLARRLGELQIRARSGELAVEDLVNGTFSVVAPSERVLLSFPRLVEPQVAVLSLGAVSRRAVVLSEPGGSDAIAIRSIGVLGLGYDSSAVDDTMATRFLERVAELLAGQDWAAEL